MFDRLTNQVRVRRLPGLQQNQNFSVVYATHQEVVAIRLQLTGRPGSEALVEYDCQQR
jgi:hypothetical protein